MRALVNIESNVGGLEEDVWKCLLSMISLYFTNKSLHIFVPSALDITPLFQNNTKTFYVSTLGWHGRFHAPKQDAVFFVRNLSLEKVDLYSKYDRVVVVTDEGDVALSLWIRLRLINTVVVVIGDKHVAAYTWFPYHPHNCHRPVHLEWLGNCSALKTWSTNLYPSKVPTTFNGCPVYYKAVRKYPDILLDSNNNLKGRETDMMNVIADSVDLTPVYVPQSFEHYQGMSYNGSAVSMIRNGSTDFAFGSMMLLQDFADFAEPLGVYRDQPIVWIFPKPRPKPANSGIYTGFSTSIWISIIGVGVSSAIICMGLHMMEGTPHAWRWLDFIAVMISTSTSRQTSACIKLFMLLLQIFGAHISWFYQSTILGNLYKMPLQKQISSPLEAVEHGLMALVPEWISVYFGDTQKEIWEKVLAPGAYEFANYFNDTRYERVVDGKKSFMLENIVTAGYYLRTTYKRKVTGLVFVQPFLQQQLTAYGYPGAPLTNVYSVQMLRVVESGIFWHLTDLDGNYFDRADNYVEVETRVLHLEMFERAFEMHAIVCFSAVIVLALEILLARITR